MQGSVKGDDDSSWGSEWEEWNEEEDEPSPPAEPPPPALPATTTASAVVTAVPLAAPASPQGAEAILTKISKAEEPPTIEAPPAKNEPLPPFNEPPALTESNLTIQPVPSFIESSSRSEAPLKLLLPVSIPQAFDTAAVAQPPTASTQEKRRSSKIIEDRRSSKIIEDRRSSKVIEAVSSGKDKVKDSPKATRKDVKVVVSKTDSPKLTRKKLTTAKKDSPRLTKKSQPKEPPVKKHTGEVKIVEPKKPEVIEPVVIEQPVVASSTTSPKRPGKVETSAVVEQPALMPKNTTELKGSDTLSEQTLATGKAAVGSKHDMIDADKSVTCSKAIVDSPPLPLPQESEARKEEKEEGVNSLLKNELPITTVAPPRDTSQSTGKEVKISGVQTEEKTLSYENSKEENSTSKKLQSHDNQTDSSLKTGTRAKRTSFVANTAAKEDISSVHPKATECSVPKEFPKQDMTKIETSFDTVTEKEVISSEAVKHFYSTAGSSETDSIRDAKGGGRTKTASYASSRSTTEEEENISLVSFTTTTSAAARNSTSSSIKESSQISHETTNNNRSAVCSASISESTIFTERNQKEMASSSQLTAENVSTISAVEKIARESNQNVVLKSAVKSSEATAVEVKCETDNMYGLYFLRIIMSDQQ